MSVLEVGHNEVERQLSALMGVLNSTTGQLVGVIADVVENETWAVGGIRSVEHCVTWQLGVSPGRARDLVQMARRHDELPATAKLFEAGLITEDGELAPMMLHTQLTRALSALPRLEEPDGEPEPAKDVVTFGVAGDRWKMRVDLSVDDGKVVEKALVESRPQVFHERHPDKPVEAVGVSSVDWSDGLVRAAELALQAAEGGANSKRRPADRYQVLIHMDLTDDTARWHMGDVLPDTVRRYLLCDADLRAVIESDGVLAAMTSRLRTVDHRMRAFVEHRDGGCVVPGCAQRRWLHIHHSHHWEDGGPTESANLCALCPLHHPLLHAGLLSIEASPDHPWGLRPPPPTPPDEPPDPPPEPFRHPVGERVDWRFFGWFDKPRPARTRGDPRSHDGGRGRPRAEHRVGDVRSAPCRHDGLRGRCRRAHA